MPGNFFAVTDKPNTAILVPASARHWASAEASQNMKHETDEGIMRGKGSHRKAVAQAGKREREKRE